MKFFISNPGGGGGATGTASITGGTATGLTSLGIRSTGAAFDLTLASSEALTAGRTLSFNVGDANRTLTVPATGTAALLGTANVFTTLQTITQANANTGILASTGYSLTGSNATNMIDLAGTWNTSGSPSLIYARVTNTASGSAAKLIDLGTVAGGSLFNVGKAGNVLVADGTSSVPAYSFVSDPDTGMNLNSAGSNILEFTCGGSRMVYLLTNNFVLDNASQLSFTGGGGAAVTLTLLREASDVLAQRRSTNAQTSRLYGTYTDASNYRRLAISSTTGGTFAIAPEGAGTGASGNVLHISGLPTSNPGPGILWNNAGTPAIGT